MSKAPAKSPPASAAAASPPAPSKPVRTLSDGVANPKQGSGKGRSGRGSPTEPTLL